MRNALTTSLFPFVRRISPAGHSELAVLTARGASARQSLIQRGDPVDGAYLVVGGSLRVFYISQEGREATLYQVEPGGACVLSVTSTLRDEPYPAWVEAGKRGASFVRVPSGSFRRLFDEEPAFREFILSVLSGRVFELMQALEETRFAQVEQRVARFLVRSAGPDGVVRATQVGIASDLGSAREVVFRALRALSDRGLVRTGRGRVEIVDPAGLRRVAETGGHGESRVE